MKKFDSFDVVKDSGASIDGLVDDARRNIRRAEDGLRILQEELSAAIKPNMMVEREERVPARKRGRPPKNKAVKEVADMSSGTNKEPESAPELFQVEESPAKKRRARRVRYLIST